MNVNLKLNMRSRVMGIVVLGIVVDLDMLLLHVQMGNFVNQMKLVVFFFKKQDYGCCPYREMMQGCYPNETCCPHANKYASEGRCVELATLPQLLLTTSEKIEGKMQNSRNFGLCEFLICIEFVSILRMLLLFYFFIK
jgi:hypothetical protein